MPWIWHSANLPQFGVIICERKGLGKLLSENGWFICQFVFGSALHVTLGHGSERF